MQKFGVEFLTLNNLSGFQNFVSLRFCLSLMNKNCCTLLDFETIGLIVYMQAKFYEKKRSYLGSYGNVGPLFIIPFFRGPRRNEVGGKGTTHND